MPLVELITLLTLFLKMLKPSSYHFIIGVSLIFDDKLGEPGTVQLRIKLPS